MRPRRRSWSTSLSPGAGLLCALLACARPARAALPSAGTASGGILRNQVSARAMGMGGAFAAVSDDVAAIHWNPAGLALLERQQLGTMYDRGLADIQTEFIGYALPIQGRNELMVGPMAQSRRQAIGVSVLASQLGKMELVRTDAGGTFQDSRTISAGSDLVASLAYAMRVSEDWGLTRARGSEFYVGATVRHWKSTLAETYSARTTVFDFGCLSLKKDHGFRWGVLVSNMGSGLKYKDKADPLPLAYRLGGAWQGPVAMIGAKTLTVAVDGTGDRESKRGAAAGLEYWSRSFAGWRAGYQWDQSGQSRWTAGLGIKLPAYSTGSLILDYGFQMIGDAGSTQRVSLTYEFGAPR